VDEVLKKIDKQIELQEKYNTDYSNGVTMGLNLARNYILVEQKECTYSLYEEDGGVWECSGCANLLVLTDGNPKDNDFEYCPFCGKKISEIVETEEPNE